MSEDSFFCEGCGHRVPRTAEECPNCGSRFRSIKCPICGFTGGPQKFSNGCPSCGYMSEGGTPGPGAGGSSIKGVPAKKKEPKGLPSWVYGVLTAVFSGILIGLLVFLFAGV